MTPRLSILMASLAFLLVSCGEEKKTTSQKPPTEPSQQEESPPAKKSLLSVPAGAVINDLTLSYYNEDERKVSLLTIGELTVNDSQNETETLLSGRALKLWLFDREESIRATTTIPAATYRLEKELLETTGEILVVGARNRFAAKSNGGIFSLATGEVFLPGPATTRFNLPEKKKN
jgi:hypothetical protein